MAVSFGFKHEKETITIELDLTKTKDNKAEGKITKKTKKPDQDKPDVFPFKGEVEILIGKKEGANLVSTVSETAGNKKALITITCIYDKDKKNTEGVIRTDAAIEAGTYLHVTPKEQDAALAALKGVLA